MAAKKKSLFKKCPSCSFKKCWDKARTCENCGYDFVLQRKPRKAKGPEVPEDECEEEEEEPNEPPPAPPLVTQPAITHKVCPDCQHKCWHKAPFCEKCEYNFRTGESKKTPKKEEKPKPEPLRPVFTGCVPDDYGHASVVIAPALGRGLGVKSPSIPELRFKGDATDENLRAWAETLRHAWHQQDGGYLSNHAVGFLCEPAGIPKLRGRVLTLLGGNDVGQVH